MAMTPLNPNAAQEPDVLMEINTTPLIDVMLVLLIMLIITIPAQLHSVNLDMPQASSSPPPVKPAIVQIEISASGSVSWNGKPLENNRAALEAKLTEAAALVPQPQLHIRSHARAQYAHVATVMASAQRLGLHQLGIVGTEQFAH